MSQAVPFCQNINAHNFKEIDFENINLAGNGKYGIMVQEKISDHCQGSDVFLTPSGSAALEMGALLIDLKPGDEVIMPSFTFTSSANAILLRGAIPVFVDIKPGSLDIDEELITKAINEKTKAIMPVFYGGASSNIDKLDEVCKEHDLFLFPDAAQAIGSYYNDKPLESFGHISALSFHQTKNIGCGEGGALVVNDKSLAKRAEIIQEKGTNRSQFFRGEVDKYSWRDIGSSYLMSELCSSFLYEPISQTKEITTRRREKWDYYYDNLQELEDLKNIQLPKFSTNCDHNGHIFFIKFVDKKITENVRTELVKKKISAVSHYFPLHMTKIGQEKCRLGSKISVTENIYNRILRLPIYDHMTKEQQDYVIESLKEIILGG